MTNITNGEAMPAKINEAALLEQFINRGKVAEADPFTGKVEWTPVRDMMQACLDEGGDVESLVNEAMEALTDYLAGGYMDGDQMPDIAHGLRRLADAMDKVHDAWTVLKDVNHSGVFGEDWYRPLASDAGNAP